MLAYVEKRIDQWSQVQVDDNPGSGGFPDYDTMIEMGNIMCGTKTEIIEHLRAIVGDETADIYTDTVKVDGGSCQLIGVFDFQMSKRSVVKSNDANSAKELGCISRAGLYLLLLSVPTLLVVYYLQSL